MNVPSFSPGIEASYEDKLPSYFANTRHDIVGLLTTGPGSAVLELGCGAGGTGCAVLAAGKAGRYVGIELNSSAAAVAAQALSEVLMDNVETLDLGRFAGKFDALIISEVLEHLTNPWTTLEKLVRCVKAGGEVYASSPNIGHWHVIRNLLLGRFDYAESGVMDRTHLRWFTPATYREMFEAAGIRVTSLGPVTPLRRKARVINAASGGRLWRLFATQIMICGRRRA
jgi:2-polyprenyl-3-methyl-5-hydroxy-6-metoxy-1,4-benzoquinol methylase